MKESGVPAGSGADRRDYKELTLHQNRFLEITEVGRYYYADI